MNFPAPGEVFANKYRIDDLLGKGGFSRVYRAVQVDIERSVALKILRPPIYAHSTEVERRQKLEGLSIRFNREATMMSKLRSPHTIIMYDYGQTDDGLLYMVLEYIDGLDLTGQIKKYGKTEPERVAKMLRQVLISLHEAHLLGMLHRDIKPQNIMVYNHLGLTDQIKLLDFGIVKLINDEAKSDQKDLTDDGTLVGTPRYMAPEYIRGAKIGPPSDIYSLGLVTYELLVGHQAIKAESSIQIIGKQLEPESFFLPQQIGISVEFRRIINRMLHKNPELRYQSASEILADLEKLKSANPEEGQSLQELEVLPLLSLEEPTENEDIAARPLTPSHTAPPKRTVPVVRADDLTTVLAPKPVAGVRQDAKHVDTFDDLVPPQPPPSTAKKVAVGVVLLLLLLIVGGVIMSQLNPEATPPVKPPVEVTARVPAKVEAPKTVVVEPKFYTIKTDPIGAIVRVDGVSMGKSPLRLSETQLSFPVSIEARLGERVVSKNFKIAQNIALTLPELEVAITTPPVNEPDIKPKVIPPASKKPTKTKPTRRKPPVVVKPKPAVVTPPPVVVKPKPAATTTAPRLDID